MRTDDWSQSVSESRDCRNVPQQHVGAADILRLMATTLAERMQWIIDNRRREGGARWDAKTLSVAAGLAPSHVGQIVRDGCRERRDRLLAPENKGSETKRHGVRTNLLTPG